MFSTYDRNYEYLAVRGFGIAGDYNSRILVLIDGHRANDPIYASAPIGTEFPVDVDLIERVEVVRGPSSSVYGSSAFFAVVNVITRRGRDLQGIEATAGAGSQDSYLGRLSHGQKLENGIEYLLSGTYQESSGDDRLYYGAYDDPATNDGIARDADDDQAYRVFANLGYRNWKLQVAHSYRQKTIPTAAFDTVFDTDKTKTEDNYTWVDLSYGAEWGEGWFVSGRTYYDRYDYYGDYYYNYGTQVAPDFVNNRDRAKGDRWGGEASVVKRLWERHQVSAGFEFDYNFNQDQWNKDQTPNFTYLQSRKSRFNFGLYLQDEITILENLHVGAGVRFDHDGEFGSTVNPRASVVYAPLEKTVLKFLIGTAYRAPSAYELFYDDGGTFLVSNPDLDPEKIWTAEVVIEQELPWSIRLTASSYYNEIDDLIEQEDIGGGTFQFQNASDVESYGFEAVLERQWQNGLAVSANYAVQRTEDKSTNSRLANSPTHLVSTRVVLPMIPRVLFLSPELRYISERKTVSGARADDSLVVNLTLFNRDWIEGLELQASVTNLFDAKNFDPASDEFQQDTIEQDGRLFFVKASYRF